MSNHDALAAARRVDRSASGGGQPNPLTRTALRDPRPDVVPDIAEIRVRVTGHRTQAALVACGGEPIVDDAALLLGAT
jgi:hypothetical protein